MVNVTSTMLDDSLQIKLAMRGIHFMRDNVEANYNPKRKKLCHARKKKEDFVTESYYIHITHIYIYIYFVLFFRV